MALQEEFQYYIDNQAELAKRYSGMVLVIKDQKVAAAFASDLEALEYGTEQFGLGTFLIQRCSQGDQDVKRMFHSRVSLVGVQE